jgi:hypothetical protein
MRKNKLTGALPRAGRPKKDKTNDAFLNVRISIKARQIIEKLPRMQRGAFVSELIERSDESVK